MTNFKGTKGKWVMIWNGQYHEVMPQSNDYNVKVASFSTFLHDMSQRGAITINGNEEDKANALLISKAPEMLEMLEKALSILENLGFNGTANQIEQLIKEATEL